MPITASGKTTMATRAGIYAEGPLHSRGQMVTAPLKSDGGVRDLGGCADFRDLMVAAH